MAGLTPRLTLGIIADDMTGALDTGVRLTACGLRVYVARDASKESISAAADAGAQAVALNTDSRHAPPAEAYARVHSAAKALAEAGVSSFYKKTDSVLRGNIGAELGAMADALGDSVAFVPFYPAQGRATLGGVQLVDGVPLERSHAARDPLNPVSTGYIPSIIARQSGLSVHVASKPYALPERWPSILVFDGTSEDDLREIGGLLDASDRMRPVAGCAGFAPHWAERCVRNIVHAGANDDSFKNTDIAAPTGSIPSALILCGSINPVTLGQLAYAREHGVGVYTTDEADACAEALHMSGAAILSTQSYGGGDPIGALSAAAARVRALVTPGITVVIGGDTLLAHMNDTGLRGMTPLCEPFPGVPLSSSEAGLYMTRSGGFGERESLMAYLSYIKQHDSMV